VEPPSHRLARSSLLSHSFFLPNVCRISSFNLPPPPLDPPDHFPIVVPPSLSARSLSISGFFPLSRHWRNRQGSCEAFTSETAAAFFPILEVIDRRSESPDANPSKTGPTTPSGGSRVLVASKGKTKECQCPLVGSIPFLARGIIQSAWAWKERIRAVTPPSGQLAYFRSPRLYS